MNFSIYQKGVSLYLTLMIMSILLALALGISAILVGQIKMTKEMGDSVVAFYAADTGIEKALIDRSDPIAAGLNGFWEELDNGARYDLSIKSGGEGDCDAGNYCIKSIGTYKKVKRAIEIKY